MALFMSLVIGTLFLSLPATLAGGVSLAGLLFQSICFLMLLSVPVRCVPCCCVLWGCLSLSLARVPPRREAQHC